MGSQTPAPDGGNRNSGLIEASSTSSHLPGRAHPLSSSNQQCLIGLDRSTASAAENLKPAVRATRPKPSRLVMALDSGGARESRGGSRACCTATPGRNWFAAVICVVCVVLEVVSIAMPCWLSRGKEIVGSTRAVSSSVSIGLFTICERTFTDMCVDYFEAARDDSKIHQYLWDVRFQDKAQQLEAVRVCAVISVLLTLVAVMQNILVPSRCRFQWLIGRSVTALLTFMLSAISVIVWFYWTEDELRQKYNMSTITRPSRGGRFKLGDSFYSMFAASLLVALAAALDLLDVCRSPSQWRSPANDQAGRVEVAGGEGGDHRLWLGQLFSVSRVSDLPPPYTIQHNRYRQTPESHPSCSERRREGREENVLSATSSGVNVLSNHSGNLHFSDDDLENLLPVYNEEGSTDNEDPPCYDASDSCNLPSDQAEVHINLLAPVDRNFRLLPDEVEESYT